MSDVLPAVEPYTSTTYTSMKQGGRLPGLYTYDSVQYGGKEYAVITIQHKKSEVRFVVDICNLATVLTKSWHLSSGKYIASHYTSPDGKPKEIYLHTFIKEKCMNAPPEKIIVHINGNMLDNRLENLRLMDASDYFPSRKNRKRTVTLPPDCGFTVDDLPKYISYMKATGEHGDRFAIEIPHIQLFLKLPSSKKVLLKDKFEEAKEKLRELYVTYPHINPHLNDALKSELNASLEYILQSI